MKSDGRRAHCLALALATALAAIAYLGFERLASAPASFLTEKYTEALVAGHTYVQGAEDPAVRAGLNDASLYHQRYYLYFGIVPFATVLAPVRAATGRQLPEGVVILGYSLGAVLCLGWLLGDLARRYFPRAGPVTLALAVLVAALGGGGLLLSRSPTIYELMAAAAWFHGAAMLACASAGLHSRRRTVPWLALAGLNAGLVVGCRPDQAGVAAALALFILLRIRALPGSAAARGRSLALAWAPLGMVGAALLWYNWLRFDNPLEFGFRYQPSMVAQVAQGILSGRYVPVNLWHYLIGWPEWSGWFPYFGWPAPPPLAVPPGYYRVDQAYGAIVTCPVAAAALLLLVRRLRAGSPGSLLALTGACGLLNLLLLSSFDCAVYRYSVDFLPYFAVGAAWGLLALGNLANRWVAAAGAALAAFSLGSSFCEAATLYDLTSQLNPVFFARAARCFDFPRLTWERFRHTPLQETRFRLLLPTDRYGRDEPLLVTGHEGLQDFIYFYYAGPGLLRIGFEAMGRGGVLSEYLQVDYRQPVTVDLILGERWPPAGAWNYGGRSAAEIAKLRERLVVRVNGQPVLDSAVHFHPEKGIAFWGRSPNDDAFGSAFSGRLLEVAQVPVADPSLVLPGGMLRPLGGAGR